MESIAPSALLPALVRQRWLIPVLACFHQEPGQRFAVLHRQLGLPRDSLARALDAAMEAGWIARNPGHGHPLRPEYIVTEAGRAAAALADRLDQAITRSGLAPTTLGRWSLPVLRGLQAGHARFNELARNLAPATPRALSLALQALVANDLVEREVEGGYPPSTHYRLTARGEVLAAAAG